MVPGKERTSLTQQQQHFSLGKTGLGTSRCSVFNDGLIPEKPDQYSLSTDELRKHNSESSENESVSPITQGRITLWTKPALLPVAFQFSSLSTCTQEQSGFPALCKENAYGRDLAEEKNTEASPLELLAGKDAAVEMSPQPVVLGD